MLKIAVVGTGIIGLDHLKAIKMSKKLELVCVCDINEERVKAISDEYKVPYFLDYKEIPKKTDAEAVILNLPHGLHCESTVFFLEAGLSVLIEKPMANTEEECERMLLAAKDSRGKLAVGHIQRFFNANKAAKEYISAGKIGKICMINEIRSINYFKPERPRWFLDKKLSGGGIVMNYGAHALDKFTYITGEEVIDVSSQYGNFKNCESIEGHAQILVNMTGGISATITFSGYSDVGYETVYIGTEGAVKLIDTSRLLTIENGKWVDVPDVLPNFAMLNQLEEFYAFVRGEDNIMPDGIYGKKIISAIEKIYNTGSKI